MKLAAVVSKHNLEFKSPAKTSRNTLTQKPLWLIQLYNEKQPDTKGIGEISPLKSLSIDDVDGFEDKLNQTVQLINDGISPFDLSLEQWPSINFGIETAMLDLKNGGTRKIFDTSFYTKGTKLPINGLVWMSDSAGMLQQAKEKIAEGFTCIKFKIGALDFDEECRMLEALRKKHNAFEVEIRLDANGAFAPDMALEQLKELARFEVHSIEQPIKQGQWDAMQEICAKSKIHVALDEELIGIPVSTQGQKLLTFIKPAYIILKPGLLGGFEASKQWIDLANKNNIGWWVTSALESNVGLNAIAQFTSQYKVTMPQGLGTGQLFTNNFESPLQMQNGYISYVLTKGWTIF